jgi:hypothetical protein
MPAQIRFRCRETLRETPRLLTSAGLLIVAAISGGCDASRVPASERAMAASVSVTQTFIARPRQHLLFTAKPSASPAAVEAYYKTNILPAVARDRRIGEVAVYVDGKTGQYIVELELRTPTAADRSLAIDVLAVGKTFDQGEQLLDGFAKYFDVRNAQQLTPRGDLSISRSVVGSVDGGAQ